MLSDISYSVDINIQLQYAEAILSNINRFFSHYKENEYAPHTKDITFLPTSIVNVFLLSDIARPLLTMNYYSLQPIIYI